MNNFFLTQASELLATQPLALTFLHHADIPYSDPFIPKVSVGRNADFRDYLHHLNIKDIPINVGLPQAELPLVLGEDGLPIKAYSEPAHFVEPKGKLLKPYVSAIEIPSTIQSSSRPELREKSSHKAQQNWIEHSNCVFYCRRSGLPIFKNPSLPYAAMLLEIPFDSFNSWTCEKIWKDSLKREANLEQRIFSFYTALSKCPVEFGPECKRPQIAAAEWDTFLSRNLHALIQFASWYMNAPARIKYPSKNALPRLRINHMNEFVNCGEEREFFRQIRSALTLWLKQKHEYEYSPGSSRLKDKLLTEAIEQGAEGILQYSLKDLKAKLRNFSGSGKLCRFDKTHPLAGIFAGQELPKTSTEKRELEKFNKLLSIYEVSEAPLRYKFILLANNPLSRNIKKLEELKGQFVECWNFYNDDDGIEAEGTPEEQEEQEEDEDSEVEVIRKQEIPFSELSELHHEFIRWLKFHIEELSKAQNMMKDMEVLEQEAKEEEKLQAIRISLNMPLRENFLSFTAYLAALKEYKLKQGEKK